MFETVLGRLQALAQAEGFDPQPGTVIDGELRAYAAGIALVYDQLTDTRADQFGSPAAGLGAALSLCPFVGQRAHLECVGRRRGALCRL